MSMCVYIVYSYVKVCMRIRKCSYHIHIPNFIRQIETSYLFALWLHFKQTARLGNPKYRIILNVVETHFDFYEYTQIHKRFFNRPCLNTHKLASGL